MFSFLKRKTYSHLNRVTISKKALIANHQNLQKYHPEASVCPVLKSNAYGHGIREVAPIFDSLGCPFLAVDSLFEAYELYKLKTKTPVLIMGYTDPQNFTLKKLPFDVAVFDLELVKTLNEYQPGCNIHIFVDTGMSREGIKVTDLQSFLTKLKKYKNLNIVGLCSHFADSDNPKSNKFTTAQAEQFKKALKILEMNGIYPKWKHISASAGSFKLIDNTFNMIRAGKAHYGISPLEKSDPYWNKIKLTPVLEFSSTLAQIKMIPKGSLVGYGLTYKAKTNTTLGLLPAGYYEGIDRRLSNKGLVKIRSSFYPIVGRVSMNMTVIDITDLARPKVGEKVIVYSSALSDKNSIKKAAGIIGTIAYELMVHINETVKRFVVK